MLERQELARQGGGWMDFNPSDDNKDRLRQDARNYRRLVALWKVNPAASSNDL